MAPLADSKDHVMNRIMTAAIGAAALAFAASAQAGTYNVREVNTGPQGTEAFDPGFIKMSPGDTLHVVPGDAGHNMETTPGMIPAGVATIRVPMGQPGDIKLTTPGIYVFRCVPHYGMGMVLMVQVGPATNLADIQAAAQKAPPLVKKRLLDDLTHVK
jgi:pseudoazurin